MRQFLQHFLSKVQAVQLTADDTPVYEGFEFEQGKAPEKIQIFRSGKFNYYGRPLEFSTDIFHQIKTNFDNKAFENDILIFFGHTDSELAGRITGIEVKELEGGNAELWGNVKWTTLGKQKVEQEAYSYTSGEYWRVYESAREGVDPVPHLLTGVALTNRPFLEGMKKILSKRGKFNMSQQTSITFEDALGAISDVKDDKDKVLQVLSVIGMGEVNIELSNANEQVKQLEGKIADLTQSDNDIIKSLQADLANLTKENQCQKGIKLFNDLHENGFVFSDQESDVVEMYIDKGEDYVKKIFSRKINDNLHTEPTGSTKTADAVLSFEDASLEIFKLTEQKAKENKLDLSKAKKLVLADNPELATIYKRG